MDKPQGYDLRDKRSSKSSDGADWRPEDALYFATLEVVKPAVKVEALMVVWREMDSEGKATTRFSQAGPPHSGASMLINALGKYQGWQT